MQINPDYNTAAYTIRAYETGEIVVYEPVSKKLNTPTEDGKPRINTRLIKIHDTFIISPRKLIEKWDVETPQSLAKSHFETLLDLKPELVILGTGEKMHFPPAKDYLFLQQQGIGVEVMTTSAACRTYNFLVSDGRNVAAGLFMI